MRVAFALAIAVAVIGGSASARTLPITFPPTAQTQSFTTKLEQRRTENAKREQKNAQAAQLQRLAKKVGTFRKITWACQDTLDIKRTKASASVWALGPSVAYRGYVLKQWQKKATSCGNLLDQRTIPLTNDWATAVNIAQRYYPNTKYRLLQISRHEGGAGPWVWYGGSHWRGYHIGNDFLGADTVGGWLQFRYSTFAPYWRQAQEDLHRRGFIIPDLPMPPEGGPVKYAGWLSPLGQALTAGYMHYYGKQGCHWCGA